MRTINREAVLFLLCVVGTVALADDPKGPPDAMEAKTTWTGQETGGMAGVNRPERPATLTVVKREGEALRLDYWVHAGNARHGVRLEGTISKGALKLRAVKILNGQPWRGRMVGTVWEGRLSDKSLTLKRMTGHNQVITTDLTLREPDEDK